MRDVLFRSAWGLIAVFAAISPAACSRDAHGPSNPMAAVSACDEHSLSRDPRCACCDTVVRDRATTLNTWNLPLCAPGEDIEETTGETTSACAPEDVADACGARCPAGTGCLGGVCEPCAGHAEECAGRACCCPGEMQARSCDSVCDCSRPPPGDVGVVGDGGPPDASDESDTHLACVRPANCRPGQPYCACLGGVPGASGVEAEDSPPTCERGVCVQFNEVSNVCVLTCTEDATCAEAADGVACGTATCGLAFGQALAKGCAFFCEASSECPAHQECRLVEGGKRLCMP